MATTSSTMALTGLTALRSALEIPPHLYQQAIDRYESLARHLGRDASVLASCEPTVYPQGSFRYGTAVPPLDPNHGYDLDLVCELARLTTGDLSQKQLKELVGREIVSYAVANRMQEPKSKSRCWHLDYRDRVRFHIDVLPAVPERSASGFLAGQSPISVGIRSTEIAITDVSAPGYASIQPDWPTSNPRGFGEWFKDRMRSAARRLFEGDREIEDVPVYEWKTPLQIAVQILKRHRDVMFRMAPQKRPISMIITTLAAHAYDGNTELDDTLTSVLAAMPAFIRDSRPRVPNPTNEDEDFADKWHEDPSLEEAFHSWHSAAQRDIARLQTALKPESAFLEQTFGVRTESPSPEARPSIVVVPSVEITQKVRPWRQG